MTDRLATLSLHRLVDVLEDVQRSPAERSRAAELLEQRVRARRRRFDIRTGRAFLRAVLPEEPRGAEA